MPRCLRPLPVLAAVALAATFAGCGPAAPSTSSKFKGDQGDVASVVDDLSASAKKGDEGRICSRIFSSSLAATAAAHGGTCAKALNKNITDADQFGLDVTAVTVTGDKATAVVKGSNGKGKPKSTQTFTFVKENGSWRINSLG